MTALVSVALATAGTKACTTDYFVGANSNLASPSPTATPDDSDGTDETPTPTATATAAPTVTATATATATPDGTARIMPGGLLHELSSLGEDSAARRNRGTVRPAGKNRSAASGATPLSPADDDEDEEDLDDELIAVPTVPPRLVP